MLQQREIMREPPDVGINTNIPLPQSVKMKIAVGLSATVIYAAHAIAHAIDAWNQAHRLDTPENDSTIAHCFAQMLNRHRHAPTRSLGHFETLC